MTEYAYAYIEDRSWMDESFGRTGPLRELADQVWAVNSWIGGDLYDVVEDWPQVRQLEGLDLSEIRDLSGELKPISEEDRMKLHIGFGGTEDEVLALRAKGTRYTLRRN